MSKGRGKRGKWDEGSKVKGRNTQTMGSVCVCVYIVAVNKKFT